ncbi:uncharacterized protein C8A04DRAFT_31316 [Dichotomopilus funicola]|uniref:Uncharacterized protein n=1 Tax=Dichotomopilus funicola TaxID=1934379 RepID=A0AAN6UY57_9PEZI|nr:hypothetical protein C8A04DRAFT_31316 [Dichotomopilus funicola]
MPPTDRKQYSIIARVQALTLHACGTKVSDIEKITGVKKWAFMALLARAKKRGYVPGARIVYEHIQTMGAAKSPVKGGKSPKVGGKSKRGKGVEEEDLDGEGGDEEMEEGEEEVSDSESTAV